MGREGQVWLKLEFVERRGKSKGGCYLNNIGRQMDKLFGLSVCLSPTLLGCRGRQVTCYP